MGELDPQEPPKAPESSNYGERASIIGAVQTPLGFFALVVLVVEALLAVTASIFTGPNRTLLIVGMLALIFCLVAVVTWMAIFRPLSLYGGSIAVDSQPNNPAVAGGIPNTGEVKTKTIYRPRIFFGSNMLAELAPYTELTARTIRKAFPRSSYHYNLQLSAANLKDILSTEKFDMVQLEVHVRKNGEIEFLELNANGGYQVVETMTSESLAALLELAEAKLLILASCDSVPLAAKVAPKLNMIAGTGDIYTNAWHEWEQIFYRLLSQEFLLSKAYSAASSIVELPIVMVLKEDVAFKPT